MLRGFVMPKIALVAVAATVLGTVVAVQAAVSPRSAPARADAPATGVAGLFVPNVGRLMDTRNGTGGYSTPMQANVARSVTAAGVAGIPTSGVSALALTLTVIGATASGTVTVTPGDVTPDQIAASIAFTAGDSVSNTSLVALHSDGHIKLIANTPVNLVVDVQGYFTSGSSTAAGGFVPVNAARIVNTSTGVGAPQAQIATGGSVDVQVTGLAGVPATATSVYVNLSVSGQSGAGYLRAYPTGGTVPTVDALDFDSAVAMSQTAAVKLNSAGRFTVLVGAGGPVNLTVDVQGYFTAGTSAAAFTPAQLHYYDSRQSSPLAAGEVRQIQVVGSYGVPTSGSGLTAVALNMRTSSTGTAASGWLRAWPDDQAEPASTNISYGTSEDYRSNVAIVTPGADGKISVRNGGNGPIDLILDVEGWFAVTLPAAHGASCGLAGSRAGDKGVSHALTDRSKLVYSPVTGNLLATGQLLHVAGIDQDTNIAWRYNAINDARPTLNLGYDEAALAKVMSGSSLVALVYTAPDGGCYRYTVAGGGLYTQPAGISAVLTNDPSNGYDLTFYPSGLKYVFADDGSGTLTLTKSVDKFAGPNTISYSYANGHLVTITDTRGKTISFAYTDPANPTQPSKITDNSLGRSVTMDYDGPNGAMSLITDATGAQTSFGYDSGGRVNSITDDRGSQTSFGYASSNKLTTWTYATATSDASAWSTAYPSTTQTTVTDPNSHATTYTLDAATNSVRSVVDADNHTTTSVFDGNGLLDTITDASGASTTATWNTTNRTLLTATSPTGGWGSGSSLSYTYPSGTGSLANYQPSSMTDSQNNTTTYNYESSGQAHNLTSVNTPANAGGTPTYRRQGDAAGTNCSAFVGELCSQVNGNGKTTSYTYDALGRVTVLTPPAPQGAINFGYDGANRIVSAGDGRGNTAYYTYDLDDRLTQVSYSATSCPTASCVTYSYDGDGNKTGRVSAAGTTVFGYDRLNRPTSKTLNAATVSTATWDGASNMLTYTDAAGTVTYRYDPANLLTYLAQPGGSCPASGYTAPNTTRCTKIDYDTNNRRSQLTYPNGQTVKLAYFPSGQVKQIVAATSGGGVLASRAYTYTGTGGNDSGLRDSMTDAVTGATTHYSYDGMNRLTAANDGNTAYSYTYDKTGNRLSLAQTGQASIFAAYNDADQQCWTGTAAAACTAPPTGATSYGYDGTGNQTTAGSGSSTVNLFNQLTSTQVAGVTTTFTYTDIDNTERGLAGATSFLNGNLGLTAQTTSGSTIEYTRDPAGNLIALSTGGTDYYYTADAIGSIILITNPSQAVAASYSYNPTGLATQTGPLAATNPWRYASGYYDTTTGLTKMGARYYNPTTGRFTQPDPSHQEPNNYVYAGDDPINNTDPTGLNWFTNAVSDWWDAGVEPASEWGNSTYSDAMEQGYIWGGFGLVGGGPLGGATGFLAGYFSTYQSEEG